MDFYNDVYLYISGNPGQCVAADLLLGNTKSTRVYHSTLLICEVYPLNIPKAIDQGTVIQQSMK